jgi:peptidoglycan hydrolase-like protein with peptidoglycan-binding domain
MNLPVFVGANVLLLFATSAFAGTALSSLHPEEAIPDNLPLIASPGPHAGFIKQVQEKLHEHGFDAGPVNGAFGTKTQAALAQFQLAQVLPASGMLDDETLQALGVARPANERGEGATAEASTGTGNAASGSITGQ